MPSPTRRTSNTEFDAFLNPNSMMTPGILGSMVTLGANSFAQLHVVKVLYLYLILSFLFGFCAMIRSESVAEKALFYLLNSIIIFSVALGANKIGMQAVESAWLNAIPSAYANDASTGPLTPVAFFQEVFPQKVPSRFRTNSCGSISDANTGLEWFVGPDKNITLPDANEWVKGLAVCGEKWSMPTIVQLATLFDRRSTAGTGWFERGHHWPAHMDPIFSGIGNGSWVWAQGDARRGFAPAFNFYQGTQTEAPPTDFYGTVRVFAVRNAD